MPASRATAPIAAAGLTSPPLVGTWVMAISFTRSSIIAASAATETCPVSSLGIDLDHCAGPLGHLQKGDDVAGVFGAGGEDAVARGEGERVKGHVPGAGGVLDQGDLVAARSPAGVRRRIIDTSLDRSLLRGRRLRSRRWGFQLRCPTIASSTGCGISAAPALLKWSTWLHPGVSRRARATSISWKSIGRQDSTIPGHYGFSPALMI